MGRELTDLIQFVRVAWSAYRLAKRSGFGYACMKAHGVPVLTVMVALNRDAWLVTERVIDRYGLKVSRRHSGEDL